MRRFRGWVVALVAVSFLLPTVAAKASEQALLPDNGGRVHVATQDELEAHDPETRAELVGLPTDALAALAARVGGDRLYVFATATEVVTMALTRTGAQTTATSYQSPAAAPWDVTTLATSTAWADGDAMRGTARSGDGTVAQELFLPGAAAATNCSTECEVASVAVNLNSGMMCLVAGLLVRPEIGIPFGLACLLFSTITGYVVGHYCPGWMCPQPSSARTPSVFFMSRSGTGVREHACTAYDCYLYYHVDLAGRTIWDTSFQIYWERTNQTVKPPHWWRLHQWDSIIGNPLPGPFDTYYDGAIGRGRTRTWGGVYRASDAAWAGCTTGVSTIVSWHMNGGGYLSASVTTPNYGVPSPVLEKEIDYFRCPDW